MPAKLVKPKTTLGNIFGVVRAPLGFILDKIDEKNASNARISIWKKVEPKLTVKYNRRLLDIAALNFDESYTIGVPEIDNQHKLIMIAYNNIVFDAARLRREKFATAKLTSKLTPLFRMIGEHFSDEEAIMTYNNYAKIREHAAQHDKFMCDVLAMLDEADAGNIGFEQIIFVIGAWISGHILISDKSFGESLISMRIESEPATSQWPAVA